VTATGLIRACEEAGRLEDACRLFCALVPQAPGANPLASPPRDGASQAPGEEAAQSGGVRHNSTGALSIGVERGQDSWASRNRPQPWPQPQPQSKQQHQQQLQQRAPAPALVLSRGRRVCMVHYQQVSQAGGGG